MVGRRRSQEGLEVAGSEHPEVIPHHSYHTPTPAPARGYASDYRPGLYGPGVVGGPPEREHYLPRKPVPSQIAKENTDVASLPTARQGNRRRRKCIIIWVLAVVIIIAVVVGGVVGGITASKKKNDDKPSTPAAGSTSGGDESSGSGASPSSSPTVVEPESNPTSSSGLANNNPLRWPKGLQYVAQAVDLAPNFGDYNWTRFDASHFYKIPPIPDSLTPSTTCLTNLDVTGTSDEVVLYKNGSPISGANITIQQRGYLYSKGGGKYTVVMPGTNDNIILFWFGAAAVSDYTRANANAVVALTAPGAADTGKSFDIILKPGDVVPVRFMWSNSLTLGVLRIDVTDPDSNSCFCNNGGKAADCFYSDVYGGSPYKFKPFGQE